VRKSYRPWRHRALVYLLTETGMRRAGAVNADLAGLDRKSATVTTREKGGGSHAYQISREGLAALVDYLEKERGGADTRLPSPALFLPAAGDARSSGARLAPHAVNRIWNAVAALAGVEHRTPHSARHAMGRHIVSKTGNLAAVQRQLGHKRLDYSAQYVRISAAELQDVLDQR
jgi:site-specific recombinase XerD